MCIQWKNYLNFNLDTIDYLIKYEKFYAQFWNMEELVKTFRQDFFL